MLIAEVFYKQIMMTNIKESRKMQIENVESLVENLYVTQFTEEEQGLCEGPHEFKSSSRSQSSGEADTDEIKSRQMKGPKRQESLCETQFALSEPSETPPLSPEEECHSRTVQTPSVTNQALKNSPSKKKQSIRKRGPKSKGDINKNVSPNFFKTVADAYASQQMKKKVLRIHSKLNIINSKQAISYITSKKDNRICLKELKEFLSIKEGVNHKENLFRKAFLAFFYWFSRHRYPIHIAEGPKKMKHHQNYLKCKTKFLYLPTIKIQLSHDSSSEAHSNTIEINDLYDVLEI